LIICAIIIILKFVLYILGMFFIWIGGPDRIDIQEIGSGTLLAEIQISNNETEEFLGKLKVTKIGDRILRVPMTLGILKNKIMETDVSLITGDNMILSLAYFDSNNKFVCIVDFYKMKQTIMPGEIIETKLIGKLGNKEPVIKTNHWSIDYRTDKEVVYIKKL